MSQKSSVHSNNNLYNLLIVAVFGAISILIVSYSFGHDLFSIFIRMFGWTASIMLAAMVQKVCEYIQLTSKRKLVSTLPFLLLIAPFLSCFDFLFLSSELGNPKMTLVFYQGISFLSFLMQILISFLVIYETKIASVAPDKLNLEERKRSDGILTEPVSPGKDSELSSKGRSSTTLENVIASVLSRAILSRNVIRNSAFFMVLIVVLGGGATFGTLALNEARKVGELEVERQRMLKITERIMAQDSVLRGTSLKKIVPDSGQLRMFNAELREIIGSRYGNENSYTDILAKIGNQTIDWPDITMRVTFAALTLFLVQILFHIYKYNQQQVSHLYTKAEALELYKDEGADQNELRAGLLSKIDGHSKFDKGPVSPTEEFLNTLGKTRK